MQPLSTWLNRVCWRATSRRRCTETPQRGRTGGQSSRYLEKSDVCHVLRNLLCSYSASVFFFGILNMHDSLFKIILNHSVCFLFETNLFKQLSCDWYVAIFKICSLWHHIAPVKEKTDGNWVWWGFCFVLFCFFFPAAQNLQTSVRSSLLLDKVRQDEHFWFYC